jgi:hypothetical protein
VFFELSMGLVMIGTDRGLLDRAVHPLDLAVGPGMVGFGKAVIDIMAGTHGFE